MRLRIATLACLANCVMSSGYAQEGEKTQRPKSNEQLRELANPGPEHRELAKYVGNWKVKIRLGSGQSAAVYSGTSRNRMVAAGRFLVCEFNALRDSENAAGVLTLGFDRRHGEFTIQSLDSWGTYFVTARGKRDAVSKPIKLYGTDDDPHMKSMGLTKEFAFGVDLTASDKFSIKIYMIDNRTAKRREMLMMEYQFTKID